MLVQWTNIPPKEGPVAKQWEGEGSSSKTLFASVPPLPTLPLKGGGLGRVDRYSTHVAIVAFNSPDFRKPSSH
jgi:hypothetical protein